MNQHKSALYGELVARLGALFANVREAIVNAAGRIGIEDVARLYVAASNPA